MMSQLSERLNTLQAEYEAGQKMLNELDAKRAQVVQTMTRIEGAMMVLRELIESGSTDSASASTNGVESRSGG